MPEILQENALPISFSVEVNGSKLKDTIEVKSILIDKEINRIATASIRVLDGGAFGVSNEAFENSDGPDFIPGNSVDIYMGYGGKNEKVYAGIIISQRLVVKRNDAYIDVVCKDKSLALTKGRNSGIYIDSKDSDVFKKILGQHGIQAEIDNTVQEYGQLVQHNCSPWDFILTRVEVNNMMAITDNNTLKIKTLDLSTSPKVTINASNIALDVDLDLDAENTFKEFSSVSWDEDKQETVHSSVPLSELLNNGNISASKLSEVLGSIKVNKYSAASLLKGELESYGKSGVSKSVLSKIKGRIQIPGTEKINPGDIIELTGFGSRFNGKAFVSKVNHNQESGDWITSIYVGLSSRWHSSLPDIEDQGAAGFLPSAKGMFIGTVKAIHDDPNGNFRIKVSLPAYESDTPEDFIWARQAFNYASNSCGFFFFPEVNDEVLVSFVNNDPRNPVVLGGLYSKKNAPKEMPDEKNQFKSIVTKSGITLRFDDEKKIFTIETPGGNTFILDDENKMIEARDLNGNKLTLNDSGIFLDSPKDISIKAKGKINLDAMDAINISSKADIKEAGLNIQHEAQIGFKAAGNASAELSASGQTTVKGAMVMIN